VAAQLQERGGEKEKTIRRKGRAVLSGVRVRTSPKKKRAHTSVKFRKFEKDAVAKEGAGKKRLHTRPTWNRMRSLLESKNRANPYGRDKRGKSS